MRNKKYMHTAVSTVVGEGHCSRLIRGRLKESTDGENIVIVCTSTHLEYANWASRSSCLKPGSRESEDLFGALNFELTFDLDTTEHGQ